MRRRDFMTAICTAALALPSEAAAEQPGKVWRIAYVSAVTPEQGEPYARALEQHLAELGYVEGRNITLFKRFAGPQMNKIEEAVISLLPQIDLLVVPGNESIAAKKLAGGVPTVFISIGYPVELGYVQSLAHPGGNMTGITAEVALETNGKRLQILKEIVPGLNRVAVLRDFDNRSARFEWTALEEAARELGLSLAFIDIRSAGELETAFASMKEIKVEALFVYRTALTFSAGKQIADLAIAAHLPSCHAFREAVVAGGLVSLGPDRVAMAGPAAAQIDKIIKGTSPADIPVEQPTRYELCINLKTAHILNLTIPPTLLARADEVIE
jgi:putative ABC transport system substrate-binding protein